tara:strand:- start:88 stop:831 length:744 start_codon:yes stop_codon:yes gene_type:complete
MILLSDNFDIDLLSIKKKLKYPNNFTFIPIKYNNADLVIQTPKLYSKYGINNKYEREFIDVSFLNKENDTSIKKFIDILDEIYLKINKKYKTNHFIKDNEKYIRFKLSSNTIIYDERKKELTNINSNTYGNYIIYLHGIWIKDNIISYEWILLQAKIYTPFYLTDYSFIEDIKDNIIDNKHNKQTKLRSNPPPPPPPLPKSFTKKYVNNKPKLQSKNQLKKKNNSYIPPTLDDITKILLKFKKNKKI